MIKQRKDSKGNILKLGEYEKKNGLYEYRYKNQDEKWCSVYADNINQLRALKYMVYMKESVCIRHDLRNMTLNDQYNMWIETKVYLRDITKEYYRQTYDSYIKNGLGKNYLNEITTNDIKACYNSIIVNRRIEICTLSSIQNILFQVFQSAKDSGSILNNPADRALSEFKRSRSKHSSSRKSLTIEQQNVLENFLKESKKFSRWYMIIYFMLHTGLRISEVIGLRWCDIDMEAKVISVNHSIVSYNKGTDSSVDPANENTTITLVVGEITKVVEVCNIESGEIEKDVQVSAGAPIVGLEDAIDALKKAVLTEAELKLVANGVDVDIYMTVASKKSEELGEDKAILEKTMSKDDKAVYLDLKLFKKIGNNDPTAITEVPGGKIKVSVVVPDSIKKFADKAKVVRVHGTEVTELKTVYDAATNKLTFETDKFSTYAIVYSEVETGTTPTPGTGTTPAPIAGDSAMVGVYMVVVVLAAAVVVMRKKAANV